jgi:hypothetical protein
MRGATVGVLGTGWACGLVLAGLWLCWSAPGRWPMFTPALVCAGLTLLAMGQFVFLSLVADRVFPELGRGVGRWIELALLLIVLVGLCGTGVMLAAGFLE